MFKFLVVLVSNSLKRFICFNIAFFSIVVSIQAQTALQFDGSTSYVEIPYAATNNPAQFTVELWARVDATGSHRSALTSRGNSTGYRRL